MLSRTGSIQFEYESSINSSSGTFYVASSSSGESKYFMLRKPRDDNDKFIKLEVEARSAIKSCQYLRKYIGMQDPGQGQQNSYLFLYQEGQTVEERIKEMMSKNTMMEFQEIQRYMFQLMNALFVLHSNNILGRVFTTSNILVTNNQQNIVMMDFGYLSTNKIAIAAPEVNSPEPIDLKSDVWLFGAFLFHLIKFKQIKAVSLINVNTSQFDQQNPEKLTCFTIRYDSKFCDLVDKMLLIKKNERISFYDILQNQYFSECPKLNEMKEFYRNSQQIDLRIFRNNDQQFDENFDTGLLIRQQEETNNFQAQISSDINNLLPPENNSEVLNNLIIGPQSYISHVPENRSECEDCAQFFEYTPVQIQSNDQFYELWNYINMEQFRLFVLKDTAIKLSEYHNAHTKYAKYVITKMRILLMEKFCDQMKQLNYAIPDIQQDLLKRFRETSQCKELEHRLILTSNQLKQDLKSQNGEQKQLCQDDQLGKLILESLQQDEKENFEFTQTENDFKMKGYRQVTAQVFKAITDSHQKAADEEKSQILKLVLQILLCHLYNRIFEIKDLKENFVNLQGRVVYQTIYNFIYKAEYTDSQRIQFINATKLKYFPNNNVTVFKKWVAGVDQNLLKFYGGDTLLSNCISKILFFLFILYQSRNLEWIDQNNFHIILDPLLNCLLKAKNIFILNYEERELLKLLNLEVSSNLRYQDYLDLLQTLFTKKFQEFFDQQQIKKQPIGQYNGKMEQLIKKILELSKLNFKIILNSDYSEFCIKHSQEELERRDLEARIQNLEKLQLSSKNQTKC